MAENIELHYDHYKDTFEQIKLHLVRRDQFFITAVLFLAGSIFTTFNPSYIQDVSNAVGKVKLGIDLNLAFYTLNSVLVLLSTWYILRYYQSVLVIENLYNYLHKVESKLCSLFSDLEISREGKSYLNPYPFLKTCIHYFYTIIFPVFVILASFIKGYWEMFERRTSIPILALIFDIACLTIIVILTLLYLSWVHFRDFKKSK